MIELRVLRDDVVVSRLDRVRPEVRQALRGVVERAVQRLQRHVLQEKLAGQVLRARRGPLHESIRADVRDEEHAVVGRVRVVGEPERWAHIHEYATAGTRVSVRGYRRRTGSVHPYSYTVRRQRSFLRSSLGELRGGIRGAATRAVRDVVREA